MLDAWNLLHQWFWLAIIIAAMIAVVVVAIAIVEGPRKIDFSFYLKRKYLFDAKSEFELFNILLSIYGDRFYVFPQVHYSHIVTVRDDASFSDRMKYWNKINRKSADFVLCDKERVVPQIVIELDGSSHEWAKRKERDEFINELMHVTDLKICHLYPTNMNVEYVRAEVDKALLPPVASQHV
jgi:hypothetical protein